MMCQNASRLIEGTYTHPLFLQSAHCSNAPTLTLLTITRTMSVPCLTSKPALVYINQGEISSSFPRDTVHHTRIILAQHVRVYYCLCDTTVYCTCARFKRTAQPPRLKWFTPSVPVARVFQTKAEVLCVWTVIVMQFVNTHASVYSRWAVKCLARKYEPDMNFSAQRSVDIASL